MGKAKKVLRADPGGTVWKLSDKCQSEWKVFSILFSVSQIDSQ